MPSLTRVKALTDVKAAADGIHVQTYPMGSTFDLPTDVAVGLKNSKPPQVEFVPEDAELSKIAVANTQEAVIVPNYPTVESGETAKLSPEDRALVAASRQETVTGVVRPEIEPVEHGGESLDRMFTRGVDADAKLVETADPVAALGTAQSASEIATITQEVDPTQPPQAEVPAASPAEQESGLAAPPSPDDKVPARRSSKLP